jgi:hypothetical protein
MKANRIMRMRFASRHIHMAKLCTRLAKEFNDCAKISERFLCRAEAHMMMADSYISH